MTLEIIERGSAREGHPSLLFVHGYWQAAWTWDEYVMGALAERGHHCLALSLRGHGGSQGSIRGTWVADYVEDVATVAGSLPVPPVVIGHSMGGFTTQHYLAAGHPAKAAILVSPVPQKGAWGATWKVARSHPIVFGKVNLTLDVGHVVDENERAMEFLVAEGFPRETMEGYSDRLERASYGVYLNMLLKRPDLSDVTLPALVVGGTEDGFFTEKEWRHTASELGCDLVMLEGIGHQPMWEEEGLQLIATIDDFVNSLLYS